MNKLIQKIMHPQIATAGLSLLTLVIAITGIAMEVVFLLDHLEKLAWDLNVITSSHLLN